MPELAREACRRAGLDTGQLGAVVAHQANMRMIEAVAGQLDIGDAVLVTDVIVSGNTSAASVPIALAKLVERGEVASDAPILLISFGGGLSWGRSGDHLPQKESTFARRPPPRVVSLRSVTACRPDSARSDGTTARRIQERLRRTGPAGNKATYTIPIIADQPPVEANDGHERGQVRVQRNQ